jgi:thiamine biosynthesis lipoprotein
MPTPAAPASAPAMPATHLAFDAIGTVWRIDADVPLDGVAPAVHAVIDAYDRTWSRFRADSLVRRMAVHPGRYRLPAEAGPLLDLYRRLHDATVGAVTPLVGRALEHHGYDADYSLVPREGPVEVPAWDDVLRRDGEHVELRAPVLLDVGAAGKGQLVDLVGAVLLEHGIERFVVDAGGDLIHRGGPPIRVALEDPRDATMAIGVVELQDGALCASAVNRRAWAADRHHVLDARTGEPTRRVSATWALAPTALEADGLATGLFFAEPALLQRDFAFSGVRVLADGRAQRTTTLPGELFA